MFGTYIKIALRQLSRNKLFTGINIVGLSLGLACVMLILLYSKDEVTFDRFHKNQANIYRITAERFDKAHKSLGSSGNTGMVQGGGFKSEIPEIDSYVRVQSEETTVRIGTNVFFTKWLVCGREFLFRLFVSIIGWRPKNSIKGRSLSSFDRKCGKKNCLGKWMYLVKQ